MFPYYFLITFVDVFGTGVHRVLEVTIHAAPGAFIQVPITLCS